MTKEEKENRNFQKETREKSAYCSDKLTDWQVY